jgi:hypothetical protein
MSDPHSIAELVASIAARHGVGVEVPRLPTRPRADPDEERDMARTAQLACTLAALPESFAWARLHSADLVGHLGQQAHDTLAAIATSGARMLTVIGAESGAGKTASALAVFREWVAAAEWPAGYFVRASTVAKAKDEAGFGKTTEEYRRAERTRVLVIDELGGEEDHERTRALLAELVWHRFDQRSPRMRTVITTPLDRVGLTSRYGEGMARRLLEPRDGDVARIALRRRPK